MLTSRTLLVPKIGSRYFSSITISLGLMALTFPSYWHSPIGVPSLMTYPRPVVSSTIAFGSSIFQTIPTSFSWLKLTCCRGERFSSRQCAGTLAADIPKPIGRKGSRFPRREYRGLPGLSGLGVGRVKASLLASLGFVLPRAAPSLAFAVFLSTSNFFPINPGAL